MVYLLGVVAVAMRCSRQVSVLASLPERRGVRFLLRPAVPHLPRARLRVPAYLRRHAGGGAGHQHADGANPQAGRRCRAPRSPHRDAVSPVAPPGRARPASSIWRASPPSTPPRYFRARVVIFLPRGRQNQLRAAAPPTSCPSPRAEEPIAQWVFDHGEKAGRGTPDHSDATAFYLPLKGAREMVGVMAVVPGERGRLRRRPDAISSKLFAHQTAIAIESARSQHAAEAASIQMQTEQMRSSLLSAVSHDLRTPLASITGAASTLRSQGEKLLPETRQELLESIADEAERLEPPGEQSARYDAPRIRRRAPPRPLSARGNRRHRAAADGAPAVAAPGDHPSAGQPSAGLRGRRAASDRCS